MKIKSLSALAVVMCLCVGSAAASDGRVPKQSLAKMGLAKMTPLSDTEGLKIRGAGFDEIRDILRAIDRIEDRIERFVDMFNHHHHK